MLLKVDHVNVVRIPPSTFLFGDLQTTCTIACALGLLALRGWLTRLRKPRFSAAKLWRFSCQCLLSEFSFLDFERKRWLEFSVPEGIEVLRFRQPQPLLEMMVAQESLLLFITPGLIGTGRDSNSMWRSNYSRTVPKKELSICQSSLCPSLVRFSVLSQIKPQAAPPLMTFGPAL